MDHIAFISHSSKDDRIASAIHKRLEDMGVKCWYDRNELDTQALQGIDYARSIVRAIDNASIFIVILSESSARSNDVKNEIDLAHKRVSQGMIMLPFRIMHEDMQEELRYYFARTNIVDGRIPPLEDRIESFCSLVKDAAETVLSDESSLTAKHAQLGRLEPAPNSEASFMVRKALEEHSPQKISRALAQCRREIEAYYRSVVDPYETYRYYNNSSVLDCPLPILADTLFRQGRYSVALGELLQFVSYFLINDGELAYVQKARAYLQQALTVFERMYDSSPDQSERLIQNIIFSQWLLSITHKQEHNYGLAEQILEGLLSYAEMQYEEFDLPYSKTVLLPKRELAIIRADGDAFDFLIENVELYEQDAKETFYTFRRAFEFYCAEQDFEKASHLKERLFSCYETCKDDLFGVYYYAMMVNVHQYCCQFNQVEEEESVYQELISKLRENHFDRYEKRVEKDRKNFLNGRRIRGYGESY